MSGKDRPRGQLDGMIHKHYQAWTTGNGVLTEYPLAKTVLRGDDLLVFVGGILKRPSESGVAFDYAIRGITAGYAGDSNRVKFTVAPGVGVTIAFYTAAG